MRSKHHHADQQTVQSSYELAASAVGYVERTLSRVAYSFHAQTAPDASWWVADMTLEEGVSTCYRAVIDLVSDAGDDPERLLDAACTLGIARKEACRTLHGIVSRVEHRVVGSPTRVRVTVEPALALLAQRIDSRIFQACTVPEVLDAVLGPALAAYGRKHALRLRRASYPQREYIVQYRESDLEFAGRLMAEEGIWYCFEQPDEAASHEGELLVLLDDNAGALEAKLGDDGAALPLTDAHEGLAYQQSVTQFVRAAQLTATSVTVRAANWTHPGVDAHATAPARDAGPRARYEPDDLTLWKYDDRRYTESDADAQARLRWEALAGQAVQARGRSNVVGLMAGQRVEVGDPGGAGAWIVTSVRARGRDAQNAAAAVAHLEDYENRFTCIPADVALRPLRRPKPRVHGIQTGRVVGADGRSEVAEGGDPIYTDAHGRIQVKLSWDRSEPAEPGATTTCFLRVAQPWGGDGWGFMFIPRVGMEVVVSFIDGDPDRPLVTGCVYNGTQRPLPALPESKTKSYIRTQSTPGGRGANELQFDDAAGREQIYLHAQRDHREVVGRDQQVQIGGDQRLTLVGSRVARVGGADVATIVRDDTRTVHGRATLRVVDGSDRAVEVSGSERKHVGKDRRLEVSGGTTECLWGGRKTQVWRSEQLEVLAGADKRDHVTGKYTIQADGHFKVEQGAGQLYLKDMIYAETSGALQLRNTGFELNAEPTGTTTISVGGELKLQVGQACFTMKSDGSIEISGPQGVKVCALGGSFEATPQGTTTTGQRTVVTGKVMAEIGAPVVKIN